ncbi:MAG: dephospho-CoA kinase [Oscillochloridaceae bacterium]|nr:dephospho-CoA kinase [Chloroflexaceae bacterium]MDW8390637.1 dephospho-CoA kinase [Oscillochloridaceae bacterium]
MKHPNVYLIGLTGGIACGKSTVLAMLADLGARTIDADRVTHDLQAPGMPVYEQIVAAFPEAAPEPGAPLDRRRLAALVFSDPQRLRQLEQIVHPAVRLELRNFIEAVGRAAGPAERPVVVIDVVKLIESGWAQVCDEVWVVTAPEEQQVSRLMATRGMSEAEARQRIGAQTSQAERLAHATVVIDNGDSLAATRAQVEAAWQAMLRRKEARR